MKKMSKRIKYLWQSPCNQCGCDNECEEKIQGKNKMKDIKNAIFGKADLDYHDCGIWIALNAPEMVEIEE